MTSSLQATRVGDVVALVVVVGKWIQWNRLRWFSHVCRMDDSRLPKRLSWAERPDVFVLQII